MRWCLASWQPVHSFLPVVLYCYVVPGGGEALLALLSIA